MFGKLLNGYAGQGESERLNKDVKNIRTTQRNIQSHEVTTAYLTIKNNYRLTQDKENATSYYNRPYLLIVKSLIVRIEIRRLRDKRLAEERKKEEEKKARAILEAEKEADEELEEETEDIIGESLLSKFLDYDSKLEEQKEIEKLRTEDMEVEVEA